MLDIHVLHLLVDLQRTEREYNNKIDVLMNKEKTKVEEIMKRIGELESTNKQLNWKLKLFQERMAEEGGDDDLFDSLSDRSSNSLSSISRGNNRRSRNGELLGTSNSSTIMLKSRSSMESSNSVGNSTAAVSSTTKPTFLSAPPIHVSAFTNEVQLEYLKSVLFKYLGGCKTESERAGLLPVLSQLLKLEPDEVKQLQKIDQISSLSGSAGSSSKSILNRIIPF